MAEKPVRKPTAAARAARAEVVETGAMPAAASGAPVASYLEWGPVFGGAFVAMALSLMLTQFGAGIGLSGNENATLDGGGISWNVLIAGLWVILVALISASAGGYIAGRMRHRTFEGTEHEAEFRDGVHGLVVWAVSSVVAMLAVSVMTALASVGVAAGESAGAAETAADALRNAASAAVVFNFASAAGAALAAAGAWFAATTGGTHRDEGTEIHGVVPLYLRNRFKRT